MIEVVTCIKVYENNGPGRLISTIVFYITKCVFLIFPKLISNRFLNCGSILVYTMSKTSFICNKICLNKMFFFTFNGCRATIILKLVFASIEINGVFNFV